jgi:acyl-CoA thioester hydrolase
MRKKTYFIQEASSPLPIVVTVEHRVMLSEVDVLGIVWHGRYPQFFEEAHTELFRRCSLTFEDYRYANLSAPIAKLEVDYIAPLYLDEIIKISAALHYSDAAKLQVSYQITSMNASVACTGCTVQIFVDLQTKQPLFLSPDIWENCCRRWRNGEFYG